MSPSPSRLSPRQSSSSGHPALVSVPARASLGLSRPGHISEEGGQLSEALPSSPCSRQRQRSHEFHTYPSREGTKKDTVLDASIESTQRKHQAREAVTLETPLLSSACSPSSFADSSPRKNRSVEPPQLRTSVEAASQQVAGGCRPAASSESSSRGRCLLAAPRHLGVARVLECLGRLCCSCCYYGTLRCCCSCANWDLATAVKDSFRVYRQYLSTGKRPWISLAGVTVPAAFLSAGFYLRGVFRFLLLDCVVIQQSRPHYLSSVFLSGGGREEVEAAGATLGHFSAPGLLHLSNTTTRTPHISSFSSSPSLDLSSLLSAQPLPVSSPRNNTLPLSPSFHASDSNLLSLGSNIAAEDPASSMSVLLALLNLSIPVFSVRLIMSLFPIVLLSYLPPKPLQMIGCILCGFMAFGIGLTLTTLQQHFPTIPPISTSTTASLLYEIGFCWCSFAPLFTSALLPLQGFHTGVRGGATAASYACSRGFTALVMIVVQLWLTLPSSCIGSDNAAATPPSGSSTLRQEMDLSLFPSLGVDMKKSDLLIPFTHRREAGKEVSTKQDQESLSSPEPSGFWGIDTMALAGGAAESMVSTSTTMDDLCSENAVTVSIIACGLYVIAATITLMVTPHVRLPKAILEHGAEQVLQQLQDDAEPKKPLPAGRLERKKGGRSNRKERRQQQQLRRLASQEWTVQWIEGEEEGVVVILDRLYVHRIKQAASGVNVDGVDEEDDDDDDDDEGPDED